MEIGGTAKLPKNQGEGEVEVPITQLISTAHSYNLLVLGAPPLEPSAYHLTQDGSSSLMSRLIL